MTVPNVDTIMNEMLERVSIELDESDESLIQYAESLIRVKYAKGFHQLASVARTTGSAVFKGLQHDVKIGQASICAEVFAIHGVEMGGHYIDTIVTVRQAPESEGGQIHLVSPCGHCRERLLQFSPECKVIIPFNSHRIKVPIRALLPAAYAVRVRERKQKKGKRKASAEARPQGGSS